MFLKLNEIQSKIFLHKDFLVEITKNYETVKKCGTTAAEAPEILGFWQEHIKFELCLGNLST